MNRLSMDLSELSLDAPCNFDEETWLTGDGFDENMGGDEEDLNKWLAGAAKKVDFRTRSALTRRLDKKKQKHENKDRTKNKMDTSLDMIEEASNESNSERDKQRDRRLSPNMRVQQAQLNSAQSSMKASSSDCTDSLADLDGEEDLFYDASSQQPKNHRTKESANPRERHHTLQPSTKPTCSGPKISVDSMTTPKRNVPATRSLKKSLSHVEESQANGSNALLSSPHHMNMSELERRAKEQEQELRMELMSHMHQDRLFPRQNGDTASQYSRPNSSSSTSSANPAIATSKSVDFRSIANSVNSEMSSSRSNDGSISDLSSSRLESRSSHNSRLPLPRRPGIPGRTGIPLPTSKSTVQLRRNTPTNGVTTPTPSQASNRYVNFDDDECF